MKKIKGRIISLLTVTALIATGTTLNVFAENGMNKINTDTINSGYNVIDKDTDCLLYTSSIAGIYGDRTQC